ncbi:DDE-type integrase/transposase/recombinase [Streptomyces sp. CNS654]|uniref:DDE-type integrase/transposase/recombinase n=1 Tax=Streptomyces sp. CNS654 TaxID=1506995 RepID=UPI003B63F39F
MRAGRDDRGAAKSGGLLREGERSMSEVYAFIEPEAEAVPAPDLIGRGFTATVPGMKPVGDITSIATDEGWPYPATWLDLATREIFGYSRADHRAGLVVDVLRMAAGRAQLKPGCIAHSDRDSEYTSDELRREIGRLGLRQSKGRTGSCFDNAAAGFIEQ